MTKAEQTFRAKVPGLMKRLMAEIPAWDVEDAAACFGNAGGESAGFTKMQEIAPTVKGSRGGYGWFQWTGPRRRAYEAWCKKQGLAPAGDDANFGFLIVELRGAEKKTVPAVAGADGLEAKVKAFEMTFERPGIPHTAGRVRWACIAMDAWQASGGKADAPVKPPKPAKPAPGEDPVYDSVQAIRNVQERLLALGYTEVGRADGSLGGMTQAAILLFRQDNGLPLTAEIDDRLILALATAPQRKLVPGRENADDKTVREKVPEAQASWLSKIGAIVVGIPAAIGALFNGILGNLDVATGYVQPVKDFVGDVPGWVWFAGIAIIAGGLYLISRHGEAKSVEAFKNGSRR